MNNFDSVSKKIPVRSAISDEDLAALINHDKAVHPEEFSKGFSASSSRSFAFKSISEATGVIAKWL